MQEMQGQCLGWEDLLQWEKSTHSGFFLPGKLCGERSLVGHGPWCCKESNTTVHTHTRVSRFGSYSLSAAWLTSCSLPPQNGYVADVSMPNSPALKEKLLRLPPSPKFTGQGFTSSVWLRCPFLGKSIVARQWNQNRKSLHATRGVGWETPGKEVLGRSPTGILDRPSGYWWIDVTMEEEDLVLVNVFIQD